MRRHFLLALASSSLMGASLLPHAALAQQYPTKPVRIIVPAPPGGTVDILARAIALKLQDALGKPVLVEYKPGAATNIGTDYVAKSAPDGYTLLINGIPLSVNPMLYANLPFNPTKDLTAIIEVASLTNVVTVHPSIPVNDMKELVALMKKEPGKMNYGTPGVGSSPHLAAELLVMKTGAKMTHIPYQGFAPAIIDHVGGTLQVGFINLPVALQFVKSGKLKALAVTSSKRSPLLPDVPTVAEALGIPDYELDTWFGLLAPAKTPPEIIIRLQEETSKVLKDPGVIEIIRKAGADVVGGSSVQFENRIKKDTERLTELIHLLGASIK